MHAIVAFPKGVSAVRIQFLEIVEGDFGVPSLREIPKRAFETPPGISVVEIRNQVMKRFRSLIEQQPELGCVCAFSPTTATPPGGFVAAEILSNDRLEPRRLQWLLELVEE